jgi:hypothetical protein
MPGHLGRYFNRHSCLHDWYKAGEPSAIAASAQQKMKWIEKDSMKIPCRADSSCRVRSSFIFVFIAAHFSVERSGAASSSIRA